MKLKFDTLLSGNFTAVDVETTGLYPENGDRVIEVAAVRVRRFEIVDSFSSLINPEVMISSKIKKICGISNEMLVDAPSFEQILTSLVSFLGNDNLVAHNASFDKKFLNAEFRRAGIVIRNKFLCTLSLSKQSNVNAGNFKLITLLNYFEILLEDALHRALSDAKGTALLFINLIKIADLELLKRSIA